MGAEGRLSRAALAVETACQKSEVRTLLVRNEKRKQRQELINPKKGKGRTFRLVPLVLIVDHADQDVARRKHELGHVANPVKIDVLPRALDKGRAKERTQEKSVGGRSLAT